MDKNIDFHIVQLFERLETLRKDPGPKLSLSVQGRANMHKELRTLELWRCVLHRPFVESSTTNNSHSNPVFHHPFKF